MKLITETHVEHIRGTISCRDRIIIQGTLPPLILLKKLKKLVNFFIFFYYALEVHKF